MQTFINPLRDKWNEIIQRPKINDAEPLLHHKKMNSIFLSKPCINMLNLHLSMAIDQNHDSAAVH